MKSRLWGYSRKKKCGIFAEVGGGGVVRWCWVNFQCMGVLLIRIRVGQGHTDLEVGADEGCFGHFSLVFHFFTFSLSLAHCPI